MRAWVLKEIKEISLTDIKTPQPGRAEVLVKVRAAGICGSDIPRIYRDGAHHMPLIPGHEFAGDVIELGEGVETGWLHKRVGVFPLIPCRKCIPCQKEQYEMCRQYSYLGSRRDGGFAEYVSVPADNLIELPDNVTYEEAAMLEPMAVAVHAMRRVEMTAADTVAVWGLGTIGILLVMFLLEKGMKNVFAIGNKKAQMQMLRKIGLPETDFCDSRTENVAHWLRERTDGAGADVCFECVGKNETYSQATELAAPGGRVCLVGNPYGDMGLDKQVYWNLLRNEVTVTGTWNSSFTGKTGDDWHYVLERLKRKSIAPAELISHRLPIEDLEQGFGIMRDKSEDYIKIMMKNS